MTVQPQTQPQAALTLDDIRALARQDLPPLSAQVPPKNAAALGTLAPMRQWVADVQAKAQPSMRHPRIALFISRHGIAADAQQDLADLPAALAKPSHPLSAIASEINADLQVYELDLSTASGDPQEGGAMDEAAAMQALAYGMMAVQPGVDTVVIALPNPAVRVAAQSIADALAGGKDAMQTLLQFGGFDIAAALGAALAARLAKAPVLLDDSAEIIAPLLAALSPSAALHVLPARAVITQEMTPAAGIRGALALSLFKAISKAA